MRFFCTYHDIKFFHRSLALFDSLNKFSVDFTFFILCLDKKTFELWQSMENARIIPIRIEDYKKYYFIDESKYKSKKEMYFSLTPGWCLYLLQNFKEIDIITYLDADVYFFSSYEALYKDLGDRSIGMSRQYLSFFSNLIFDHPGHFNVGINMFRNDSIGIKCLNEWKNNCDEWRPDKKNSLPYFSDQIFLDSWPELYKESVKVFDNLGINVMPANLKKNKITKREDGYYVDDVRIVAYHFMQLHKISKEKWNSNAGVNFFSMKGPVLEMYLEYVKQVESYDFADSEAIELRERTMLKKILKSFLRIFYKEYFLIK